jgi:hypothetical protein
MPVMPRSKKAKKISDKVMKKSASDEKDMSDRSRKADREPKFDRDVRTMIKR